MVGETYDYGLIYPDPYEKRLFDLRRYEMSKHLPTIIQALPIAKPRHNGGLGKFFSVEIITESGERIEYDIFFKVKKGNNGLEMIVETAFIREPNYDSARPDGKPIRFWIILHHTLHGIKIRL
jgi:hypothetical protein